MYGPEDVAQSTETTFNKKEVTSSKPPLPFVWTYQKIKKYCLTWSMNWLLVICFRVTFGAILIGMQTKQNN